MADPQQILGDPAFHALPLQERLKVMRTVDPHFAGLSAKDQGTVIYQSALKLHPTPEGSEGPPDEGFLSTLGSDIWHLPESLLRLANPVMASQDVVRGMHEMGSKAVDALHQGDPLGALGYGTAAAIPLVGPAAARAGEEYQQGQYGQGTAHALELLAPFMREGVPPVARGARGAVRGGIEGAKSAPASPLLSLTGEQLGQALGHPVAGAAIGAVLPKVVPTIKGMVKGGIKGLLEGPADPRYTPPVWQGVTSPEAAALPDLSPIQSQGLPSGRVPGPIKPSTVDLSTPESLIPPVQPSAPAGEVVTGLHLPEVPKHYAGEPNPTAAFRNDQAIVAELRKVPGITQQSLTADMVHEVRKALGQRKLKDVDVERRVQHIRHMLPK